MAGPAVTSPFGNGPDSLAQPDGVPSPQAPPDLTGIKNIVQGTPQPGVPAQPPVPVQPAGPQLAQIPDNASADDIYAQMDGGTHLAPDDQMSPLPEPEGWASAKEQLSEAATRFKNAFTVTGKESVDVLKSSGLFDDVRKKGDEVQVKRKGRGGWEPFDRDKIELLGDAIDMSRDVFEGIVENTFRAGATAAGTIAEPGGGTYLGAATGGAAGAVVAKNVGDEFAQGVLGIPRDPERSTAKENALAAGFGGAFSVLGSKLARNAAAREISQTEARKTLDHASNQVAQTVADIEEVQNSGIKLGTDGKFKLDPMQAVGAGQIPELDATAKELSTEQSFRNFRQHIGDSLKNAYDSVAQSLGAAAGKDSAKIGEDFVLTSKDVRNVEGKLIGNFRRVADEGLAGEPQLAGRFVNTLQAMQQELPADAEDAALALGVSTSKAKQVQSLINGYVKRAESSGGAFTVDEMQQFYKQTQGIIDANSKSNPGLASKLWDLRNSIRDDWTDAMGKVLPPSQQEAYQKSLGRYRQIIGSTQQLGNLLDTENISRNELIGKLFEGKGSYKFAQSAKTLIQETNPKLWNSLTGEYFNKLRTDATDAVSGSVNWGQMAKKWQNVDPRLQQDLLDGAGIKSEGMDALLRLGTKVQGAEFSYSAKQPELNSVLNKARNVWVLLKGGGTAQSSAAKSMIEGMGGKDQAVMKWMQDGGVEQVIKQLPGIDPGAAANLRNWAAEWKPIKAAVKLAADAPEPVKTAAKGAKEIFKAARQTGTRRRAEEATAD